RGEFAPTRYPIVPGHEFCGEVVAIGSEVRNVKVGDFVAVDPTLYDGTCRQCRAGRFNLCENWNGIGVARTDGACAELVRVDATGVVPAIEDGLKRVSRGGTFLMFGVANADAMATFSPFRVYNDEIKIIGSMAVVHSFERALKLLVKGVIDCEAMITNRFGLDDYSAAIDAFLSGKGLKVQVTP